MTIRKSMIILLCLLMPSLGIAEQVVTFDQTLHFKWKGLSVATLDFKGSLPVSDHRAAVPSGGALSAGPLSVWPKTLIEVTGRTRGPLRLFEDYQATVKYLQLDANGKNAMTLIGQDNGEPEQREILFAPSVIPQVSIFEDSTVKHALQPQSTWAHYTSNPLSIFKLMLESGINDKECAAQTWGYDGKRRYLLRLEQNEESASSVERSADDGLLEGELARRYICKITMHAEGRQNAASDSKPSILASRMAALWPFGGGDLEFSFDFLVYVGRVESGGTRLVLDEIRVATPLGAIIGKN